MGFDTEALRVKAQIKQEVYKLSAVQAAEAIGIDDDTYRSFLEGSRKSHDGTLEKIAEWVDDVGKMPDSMKWYAGVSIGLMSACLLYIVWGLIEAVYGG